MNRFHGAAVVSSALMLSLTIGCGTPQSHSDELVYGGNKVSTGAWPSVVAITQKGNGIYCTGTAISPKIVITAGHCAVGFKASTVSVYVGSGAEGGGVTGQYPAASITPSPKYNGSSEGNDISYILLSKPLDLPASAYVPVLTDPDEQEELLEIGKTGHVVGFGNRENGGFGVKFEVDAKITKRDDLEVTLGGNGKDSCNGDSGGPVFGKLSDGSWRVYGVTSRGEECGSGGIYGLMHANICWVQEHSGLDLGLPDGSCES